MSVIDHKHPLDQKAQEELMAFFDGELSGDRALETAAHLENCSGCRQLAADLKEVSQMVQSWQVEEGELEPNKALAEALEARTKKRADLGDVSPAWRIRFSRPSVLFQAASVAVI